MGVRVNANEYDKFRLDTHFRCACIPGNRDWTAVK